MSIEWRCIVCLAKPGVQCHNTIHPGEPLPNRTEHYARAIPPNPKEAKK